MAAGGIEQINFSDHKNNLFMVVTIWSDNLLKLYLITPSKTEASRDFRLSSNPPQGVDHQRKVKVNAEYVNRGNSLIYFRSISLWHHTPSRRQLSVHKPI